MEQQISARVSILETDVAVIQSNYVRRDEFAELRATVEHNFHMLDAKVDSNFEILDAKIDSKFEILDAKIDREIARLGAKLDRAIGTILKWMFAMQFTTVALLPAGVKYL